VRQVKAGLDSSRRIKLLSSRDLRLDVQCQGTDHGGDVFPSSADHGDDANGTESQRALDSQDGCDHVAEHFKRDHGQGLYPDDGSVQRADGVRCA
jgi:hypothetical protein